MRDANTPRPSRQKAMSINAVTVRSEPHPNQYVQASEIESIVALPAGFGCDATYANALFAKKRLSTLLDVLAQASRV